MKLANNNRRQAMKKRYEPPSEVFALPSRLVFWLGTKPMLAVVCRLLE